MDNADALVKHARRYLDDVFDSQNIRLLCQFRVVRCFVKMAKVKMAKMAKMAMTHSRRISIALGLIIVSISSSGALASNPPRKLGGDRDAHGCIGSAGYVHSRVRNSCIRLFETGLRLDAIARQYRGLSAFVVFHTDDHDGPAELFLPGHSSIALRQRPGENAGEWNGGAYRLTQWKGVFSLEDRHGKTMFQGPSVR